MTPPSLACLALLLATAALSVPAGKVRADTLSINYCVNLTNGTTHCGTQVYTVGINKSVYTPGETLVASGNFVYLLCLNTPGGLWRRTVDLAGDRLDALVNGVSRGVLNQSQNFTVENVGGNYAAQFTGYVRYTGITGTHSIPYTVVPPPQPRIVVCPAAANITVNQFSRLQARFWSDFPSIPDCASTGYTDVTTSSTWAPIVGTNINVNDTTSKGSVVGTNPGSEHASATYSGLTARSYVTVAGASFSCSSPSPVGGAFYPGDDTGLTANAPTVYRVPNTTSKCEYRCVNGYTWNGAACVRFVATNVINATDCTIAAGANTCSSSVWWTTDAILRSPGVYQGGTSLLLGRWGSRFSQLASSSAIPRAIPYGPTLFIFANGIQVLDSTTATAACASGTSWDGSVCAASTSTFSCTGTTPSNASIYPGDDTGLTADTPKTRSVTNTSTKCEYGCNAGYTWNGSTCAPVTSPQNGSCGSADGRVYTTTDSTYAPYLQCSVGASSNTQFPAQGSSELWTCSGINGGSSSGTCSASRLSGGLIPQ